MALMLLLLAAWADAQSVNCLGRGAALDSQNLRDEPQFFDEPQFTVAGVTDNTYRGGHGSDTMLRTAEALARATASLGGATGDVETADPHHELAEADERSGDALRAVQEFQRAAETNPSETNLFDWGTELLAHRAPQPAAEIFTKGVRLFPKSMRMLLGLAAARYAAGSYADAAPCFFEAADLAPNDPDPYLFLAKVRSRQITESAGYEERIARFAKLQPKNALANYYLAIAIWNRRRGPEDAEASARVRDLLQKAIALDPHLGPAYLQLGILYAEEHKYPEAIRAYQQAIDVSPGLEEAHYRLAEGYRATGDPLRAEQETALYDRLSKESAEEAERERREIRQFVIALRSQRP
jgi:tetratricopeptide (TPR) repeat protein